jgi:hypothetical protein
MSKVIRTRDLANNPAVKSITPETVAQKKPVQKPMGRPPQASVKKEK